MVLVLLFSSRGRQAAPLHSEGCIPLHGADAGGAHRLLMCVSGHPLPKPFIIISAHKPGSWLGLAPLTLLAPAQSLLPWHITYRAQISPGLLLLPSTGAPSPASAPASPAGAWG